MSTGIAWTDETWNPVRATLKAQPLAGWHCERVSAGCDNCYAETLNVQRSHNYGTGLTYTRQSRDQVDLSIHERALMQPLRWRKPKMVFVCSMTDLFGEWVNVKWLDRIFAVMSLAEHHTFQVLTKRPQLMQAYMSQAWIGVNRERWDMSERLMPGAGPLILPNVWVGTSVEDQRTANTRIPDLLATPAAVRWISMEPQLDSIKLDAVHPGTAHRSDFINQLDWVVQGGESGKGARPFDVKWARSVRDQCADAGVPYFLKQLGTKPRGLGEDICDRCVYFGPGGKRSDHGPDCQGRQLLSPKGTKMDEWPEDLRQCQEWPNV